MCASKGSMYNDRYFRMTVDRSLNTSWCRLRYLLPTLYGVGIPTFEKEVRDDWSRTALRKAV